MAKNVNLFKAEVVRSYYKHHAVIVGNLFLFFNKIKDAINRPGQHNPKVAVDFLVWAVRALGKDNYDLNVLGIGECLGPTQIQSAGRRAACLQFRDVRRSGVIELIA